MGLFDIFKSNKKKTDTKYADHFDYNTPIFSMRGRDIYASDIVQQCLACISTEMSKAIPKHIIEKGSVSYPSRIDIQRVLDEPNEYMNTSDFIEKITNNLLLNSNCFIYPIYDVYQNSNTGEKKRVYKALYPLQPREVIIEKDASDTLYVHFKFENSQDVTLPYEDVIHLRRNYSINEYLGGNKNGQPDNRGLQEMLDINATLLESVQKTIQGSYAVSGIVKYNTMLDKEAMEKDIARLEQSLRNGNSGILGLDLQGEYIPITRDLKLVDKDTLAWIDSVILRHYGVSLAILTGDFTKAQKEAFYEKSLEPLIIKFGQEFTKKMFTATEKSYGNKIVFYPKELIFMTASEKLKMIEIFAPAGTIQENEKREILGLKPLAELEGKRMVSLNWVDSRIADEYQLQKKKEKEE